MVSVKVDLCTRRKRHFIGINLQLVVEDNLRVIIGVLNDSHELVTAVAIAKNIVSCIVILEKEIYSLAKLLKVRELMRSGFLLCPKILLIP